MPDLPVREGPNNFVSQLTLDVLHDAGESAYRRLVVRGPEVTPARRRLEGVRPEQLLTVPVKHPDAAAAALAGLWLWVDDLDACHRIAQDLVSPTGSFWHAVMHRLEGDFSNAKYWYARCASHHVNRMLGAVASSLAADQVSDRLVARAVSGGWNPDGFTDLVKAVHDKPADPRYELAVRLQRAEWEALFDYCVREAVESDQQSLDAWDERAIGPAGG